MREAFDANMGQYAHSNEPVHSALYLYNYASEPFKTQARVREVLERSYSSGIASGGGYLGDEDNGQMSAWYIFSAMGFYPASPGHPEYAIGSPLFGKVVIHLENGKQFSVIARNNSRANKYIQSARLNGQLYSKNYLAQADIMNGGLLEFEMGDLPSRWGTGTNDLPTSITSSTSSKIAVPRVDRAVGGVVTASSENPAEHAGASLAFDDNSRTNWQALKVDSSIQYRFPKGNAYTVSLYTVTSAGDAPERDPKDWTLQASADCSSWVNLDIQANQTFPWRQYAKVYPAKNATPYPCYRLNISANHGAGTTQLSEIELIGDAPIASAAARTAVGCQPNAPTDKATDGSLFTKWCSRAPALQLEIDLKGQFTVNQFVIFHAGAGGEPEPLNTRDFAISVSPDDVNWTVVASVTGNHEGVTQHTIKATRVRKVRLSIVKPNQDVDQIARIYEVEIYGQPLISH